MKNLPQKNQRIYYLLCSVTVFIFLSCIPQNTDIQIISALKSNLNSSDLKTTISDSPNNFLGPCDRVDIDPCDYGTNAIYAGAMVSELEHQINDCLLQSLPPCNIQNGCCSSTLEIQMSDLLYYGTNPWFYCFERTNCDSFYCNAAGAIINIFGSIALQDFMISSALNRAAANRPVCSGGNPSEPGSPPVYGIVDQIEFNIITQRFICTGDDPDGCYNSTMFIKVHYRCYNCGNPN